MKIGLVGGIFNPEYEQRRGLFLSIPETLLEDLFRKGGHEVETFPLTSAPRADVDLFHVHHFGPAALHLCLVEKHRPVVFTSHNPFIASRYRGNEVSNNFLFRTLFSLVLRNADGVVALSQAEAQVFQKDFKISSRKIRVIHNGLPISLYAGPKVRMANQVPLVLLSVGQLEKFKGHIYLLEAIASILSEHPSSLRLIIVSQNPQLLPELKLYCEQHGIVDAVAFENTKATLDLLSYYQGCDVYVQPSLAESFPITIMEAQACGKPVIASSVAGIPEQISPETGLLVSPADAQALAWAIKRLMDNPQERVAMGQAARDRALVLYDPERLYAEHIAFYEQVLSQPMKSVPWRDWPYKHLLRAWWAAKTRVH